MKRPLLVLALLATASAALVAQEASQSNQSSQPNQYSGTSNPPPDDTIITDQPEQQAKPPAGVPMVQPQAAPAQQAAAPGAMPVPQQAASPQPAPAYSSAYSANGVISNGTDDGIVGVAPAMPGTAMPALQARDSVADPDGGIVHPALLPPGVIAAGTPIRARLMGDLSSGMAEQGQEFRSRVSADVEQNGVVVIPAGSEIDGTVSEVSTGHFGGQGSLLLRPDRVILPDGSQYRLHAEVTGTPMSRTHVGAEGVIRPNDNLKRDGIEYGGGVGAGVVAGAFLGGPVGALAGGLVGAGLVTVHMLVSHPQAHIDSGDVLEMSLTENMRLEPVTHTGE